MAPRLLLAAGFASLAFAGCSDDDFGQTNPHADLGVVVVSTDMASSATANDLSAVPTGDLAVAPVDMSAGTD